MTLDRDYWEERIAKELEDIAVFRAFTINTPDGIKRIVVVTGEEESGSND